MPTVAPDVILTDATIRTMDARCPVATTVAISRDRFVAVGDDRILDIAGKHTEIRRLNRAVMLPGLVDAHNHLLHTSRGLQQLDLLSCRSIPEILERVAQQAEVTPPGDWILGRGWDENLLAERRAPTRHDLDAVTPNHPTVLLRVWNQRVCNSLALRLAGVDRSTPDPDPDLSFGGWIARDASGEPTGLFSGRAQDLIWRHVPKASPEATARHIGDTCRRYNQVGITAVGEPGLWPSEIRAYQRAARMGVLSVRVDVLLAGWGFAQLSDEVGLAERFSGLGFASTFGADFLRIEGIKLLPDGGVGDRTARMFEPYPDPPLSSGEWIIPPDELHDRIRFCHDLGFSVDCHACGDATQEAVVTAMASAQKSNPQPWLRHRVHHGYFPTPRALALMRDHAIGAILTTNLIVNCGDGYIASLGLARAAGLMPARTYLRHGIRLAASSDSPVSDFSPWLGMEAAMDRRTAAGQILSPAERLTRPEVLYLYTMGGARATAREDALGSITVGKFADLLLLERDPLDIPPGDYHSIRPVATMVGGQWVYDTRSC